MSGPQAGSRGRSRGSKCPGWSPGLERENGWTLAEQAGEVAGWAATVAAPGGLGHRWVRDDVRDYVVVRLGEPGGVPIVDDTGS